jgi:hypothetical protein
MKRASLSLGLLIVLIAGLAWSLAGRTPLRQMEDRTGLSIGEPIQHGNLTIFPVVSLTPRTQDRFITLDEGLRTGMVEILEAGAVHGDAGGNQARLQMQLPTIDDSLDPFVDDDIPAQASSNAAPENSIGPDTENGEVVAQPEAQQQEPAQQEATDSLYDLELDFVQGNDNVHGGGNSVNTLYVVNRSDKPLYLMPGEILLGGDQDRTVGQELVIAPTEKPVPIEVFCVEHGRWGGRTAVQYGGLLANANPASSDSVALLQAVYASVDAASWSGESADFDELRDVVTREANSGKFVGSVGSLNKSARLAVQLEQRQERVWEEVAKENEKAGVQSESGTFTGNYANEDAVKRLEPYMDALQQTVADTPNVVGVIVAVNGKVESFDTFESSPLFLKLWPKLLKSYALDAANADDTETAIACSREQAVDFFAKAQRGAARQKETSGGVAVTEHDSDEAAFFFAYDRVYAPVARRERPFVTQVVPAVSDPTSADIDAADVQQQAYGGAIHSAGFAK